MKTQKIFLFIGLPALLLVMGGCGDLNTQMNGKMQKEQTNRIQNQEVNQSQERVKAQEKEELQNQDRIHFSNPGNGAMGKEIQEMDDLINETTPSEYENEALSDEALEAESY